MMKIYCLIFTFIFLVNPSFSLGADSKNHNKIIYDSCKSYLEYLLAEETQDLNKRRAIGASDGPCIGYFKASLDVNYNYGQLLKKQFCPYENKSVKKVEGFEFAEKLRFEELIPHYVVFMSLLKMETLTLSPLHYIEIALSDKYPCNSPDKGQLMDGRIDAKAMKQFCEQYYFYAEGEKDKNLFAGICQGYFMALSDFNNHKTKLMKPLFCQPKSGRFELSDLIYAYTDHLSLNGVKKTDKKNIEEIIEAVSKRFPCRDNDMKQLLESHKKKK